MSDEVPNCGSSDARHGLQCPVCGTLIDRGTRQEIRVLRWLSRKTAVGAVSLVVSVLGVVLHKSGFVQWGSGIAGLGIGLLVGSVPRLRVRPKTLVFMLGRSASR